MLDLFRSNSLSRRGLMLHGAGLGVTVALAAVAYGMFYVPLDRSQAALERTARACESFLSRNDAVQSEHADLTRHHAATEQRVTNLVRRIPETAQESEFLAELATLAQRTGFVLHDYRPGDIHPVDWHNELEIQLHTEGNYESLCRFLLGLESLDRFCRLSELGISNSPDMPQQHTSRMTLQIFFASAQNARGSSPESVAKR
ncbi:MAG: type 4a pilus biogenesis protein PilO [Planctomycetaceae bacterium]|nr:type 4a pilus biogenesis protein PilO [Planctomycetaceae bacterium]